MERSGVEVIKTVLLGSDLKHSGVRGLFDAAARGFDISPASQPASLQEWVRLVCGGGVGFTIVW